MSDIILKPSELSQDWAASLLADPGWRLDPTTRGKIRNDADASNALALQLEQMMTKVIEYEYTKKEALDILPVSTELSPMADTFAWREEQWAGGAKIISASDVTDFPSVESKAEKQIRQQVMIGNKFSYSFMEMQRAAMLGYSLDAKKGQAARRAAERLLDQVVSIGDSDSVITTGFLNNASVNSETLSADFGSDFQTDLTELNDFANAFDTQLDDDAGEAELLLPRSWFRTLTQQRASVDNGESTLEAFLRANPWVTSVRTWRRLESSGTGGVKQAVIWTPNADTAEVHLSAGYSFLPPERRGMGFDVIGYLVTGGCTVYKPLHMRYLDGV